MGGLKSRRRSTCIARRCALPFHSTLHPLRFQRTLPPHLDALGAGGSGQGAVVGGVLLVGGQQAVQVQGRVLQGGGGLRGGGREGGAGAGLGTATRWGPVLDDFKRRRLRLHRLAWPAVLGNGFLPLYLE